VGGPNGKYLFCPGYRKGICTCQTQLRRDRAERLILREIGQRILSDAAWFAAVCEETQKAWQALEDSVPAELAAAEQELASVEHKINRLVDSIESGLDDPSVTERLNGHRQRRRELAKRIDGLRRSAESRGPAPTVDWVREQLLELGQCLQSDDPAAAFALQQLVQGAIVVTEVRREGRSRHQLRGHFRLAARVVGTLITNGACSLSSGAAEPPESLTEEITIDFVDANPLDAKATQARVLYDQGLKNLEIARQLGWSRSQVTNLIRHSFSMDGQDMPDGRARRIVGSKSSDSVTDSSQL
jgi:hypothetical protein